MQAVNGYRPTERPDGSARPRFCDDCRTPLLPGWETGLCSVCDAHRRGDYRDLLGYIPADDRENWVRVGGILKRELGDAGFEQWDSWSRTSDRYIEKDARAVWRSLKGSAKPARVVTLIWLAKQNGYRFPNAYQRRPTRPPVVASAARSAPTPITSSTEAYALRCWASATDADAVVAAHPYAQRKHIGWAGGVRRGKVSGRVIGQDADCLLVPCFTNGTGKLQGVQAINADGAKQSFGRIAGGCLMLGNTLATSGQFYVAEGWATAFSTVFHHGGGCCAAAFGKGNLDAVAELVAREFKPAKVAILGEVDE